MNQVAGYIENEIGSLKDSNEKLIKGIGDDLKGTTDKCVAEIKTDTISYIREVERLKEYAKKEYDSFFEKKKLWLYIIAGELLLVSGLLVHWIFFK